MNTSARFALATVAAAIALASPASPVRAWQRFSNGACAGSKTVRLYGSRVLQPRCGQLDGPSAHRTWADEGLLDWAILDDTWAGPGANPTISIGGSCTNTPGSFGSNTVATASRSTNPSFGIAYVDDQCNASGNATWRAGADLHVPSQYADLPSHCATATVTENGTWVHEAGHLYGFAHFDDWLSTMNSWVPDITSCTPSRFARPSSDAQQGFKGVYGLPAAVDVGITPIVQTGSLLSGGWSVQNSTYLVARDRTSLIFPIKFTFMNMRDAWPNSTVRVAFYLSNNATLSSDDTRLNSTLLTATFAGAIYPYTLDAIMNPQTDLPIGVMRCILVVADPDQEVLEFAEYDNVTNTNVCFQRQ